MLLLNITEGQIRRKKVKAYPGPSVCSQTEWPLRGHVGWVAGWPLWGDVVLEPVVGGVVLTHVALVQDLKIFFDCKLELNIFSAISYFMMGTVNCYGRHLRVNHFFNVYTFKFLIFKKQSFLACLLRHNWTNKKKLQ
jgi:hypothetical protein